MGPIPWTAVIQYASYMGIDDQEEIEWFTTLIQSLDSTLLNELGKKADG